MIIIDIAHFPHRYSDVRYMMVTVVERFDLNIWKEVEHRSSGGASFQSIGAVREIAPSPSGIRVDLSGW